MQKRKRYTPEFKAQLVLEILKEEKSLAQLSSEHRIHVNRLRQWRNAALEQLPGLFTNENKKQEQMKAEYEEKIETLYAEVGRLTTQLSWLKKKIWPPRRLEPNASRWWNGSILNFRSRRRRNG